MLYYPFSPGALDIIVDVVPASALPTFSVPGLTSGVTQTWMYEYRFTGLEFN